jgi:hypothetical protein
MADKASTVYVIDEKTRRRERFALKISKNSLQHYEEKYG